MNNLSQKYYIQLYLYTIQIYAIHVEDKMTKTVFKIEIKTDSEFRVSSFKLILHD